MAKEPEVSHMEIVEGDNLEPDESRTPVEFADEDWLTLEQVAGFYQVPSARVREWIVNGLLSTEPGGSVERIARTELERVGNPDDAATEEFEKDHSE